MIDADRVISWAEEKLHLKKIGTYEHQSGRIALADAMMELRIVTPSEVTRATITTVAAQSEYDLPADTGIVDVIHWPEEWDGLHIRPVTHDFIREARRQISDGVDDLSTAQPWFYAIYTQETGQKKIALERASGIEVGLTFNVDYFPFLYDEPDQGENVDLPSSLELALKYGTAWHLAEEFNEEKVQYFLTLFKRYQDLFWQRQTFQSNEDYQRPTFEF